MLTMKRVGRSHYLALDLSTDKSHLFSRDDFEQSNPLLTFDSHLNCTDAQGKIVCRISTRDNYWVTKNNLGIITQPVSMNQMEGTFDVEAEFCEKWLELQTVTA